jgi:hypothetical protein
MRVRKSFLLKSLIHDNAILCTRYTKSSSSSGLAMWPSAQVPFWDISSTDLVAEYRIMGICPVCSFAFSLMQRSLPGVLPSCAPITMIWGFMRLISSIAVSLVLRLTSYPLFSNVKTAMLRASVSSSMIVSFFTAMYKLVILS